MHSRDKFLFGEVNKCNYNNKHFYFKWKYNDKIKPCKWKQTNIYYTISFIWGFRPIYHTHIYTRSIRNSILLLYILFSSSLDSLNYLMHYCVWTQKKKIAVHIKENINIGLLEYELLTFYIISHISDCRQSR